MLRKEKLKNYRVQQQLQENINMGEYKDITKTGGQNYIQLQKQNADAFARSLGYNIEFNPLSNINEGSVYSPISINNGGLDYWGSSIFDPEEISYEDWEKTKINTNEVRAENQPWISKLGSGIGKGVALAATTFLDGTVGLIAGLASIPSSGIYGIWNNGVSNALQEFNRDMEKWLPNYRTQEEIDRPWYQNLGTMNFWADSVIKNLGFTVGAF